jgi:Rrf2 family protein
MSLIFSRECEYALQAVLFLALRREGEMTSIKDLVKILGLPYHFLAKILQRLTQKGLLISLKGPQGGFALAMPADEITLLHIVQAVDGTDFTRTCVLGFAECSGTNPCAVHKRWQTIREDIHEMMVGKSVAQLAREMKKPQYQR